MATPSFVHSTPSLLLATWIAYSEQNRFIGFSDGKFHFDDSGQTIQFLIAGYHDVDPRANIHKFEKCRSFLMATKRRSELGSFDGRQR